MFKYLCFGKDDETMELVCGHAYVFACNDMPSYAISKMGHVSEPEKRLH